MALVMFQVFLPCLVFTAAQPDGRRVVHVFAQLAAEVANYGAHGARAAYVLHISRHRVLDPDVCYQPQVR